MSELSLLNPNSEVWAAFWKPNTVYQVSWYTCCDGSSGKNNLLPSDSYLYRHTFKKKIN